MKKFEIPEIEVVRFHVEDIITNSNHEFPIAPLSQVSEDECDMISLE